MTIPQSAPRRLPQWVHRVDDGLYAGERLFVVVAMAAMILMVFFDVLDRRLSAPEGKLAALLLAVGRGLGLRPGEGGAPWVAELLAPVVGAALLGGLIWFGLATVRRRTGRRLVPLAVEPLLALLGVGLLFALGWVMLHRPSRDFYTLVLLLIAGVGSAEAALRRQGDYRRRLLGFALLVPAIAFALRLIIPDHYSWAKEVAMNLLVWTGFVGASMAAHEGRHIDIDITGKLLGPQAKRIVAVIANAITFAFCALLLALGIRYVFGATGLYNLGGRFPHTGIPDWIVAFAIPWSFFAIAARTVITTLRILGGDLGAKGSSPTPTGDGSGHGVPAPATVGGEAEVRS